jgi:hypothetical protein
MHRLLLLDLPIRCHPAIYEEISQLAVQSSVGDGQHERGRRPEHGGPEPTRDVIVPKSHTDISLFGTFLTSNHSPLEMDFLPRAIFASESALVDKALCQRSL